MLYWIYRKFRFLKGREAFERDQWIRQHRDGFCAKPFSQRCYRQNISFSHLFGRSRACLDHCLAAFPDSEKDKAAGSFRALRHSGGLFTGRDFAEKYRLPGTALSGLPKLHFPADLSALRFFLSLRTHLRLLCRGHGIFLPLQKMGDPGSCSGLPYCLFPRLSVCTLAYRCTGRRSIGDRLRALDGFSFQEAGKAKDGER